MDDFLTKSSIKRFLSGYTYEDRKVLAHTQSVYMDYMFKQKPKPTQKQLTLIVKDIIRINKIIKNPNLKQKQKQ